MRYFSIKKVFRKLIFCCTQCVCVKHYFNKRCKKKIYTRELDFNDHPIHDLEAGEL